MLYRTLHNVLLSCAKQNFWNYRIGFIRSKHILPCGQGFFFRAWMSFVRKGFHLPPYAIAQTREEYKRMLSQVQISLCMSHVSEAPFNAISIAATLPVSFCLVLL